MRRNMQGKTTLRNNYWLKSTKEVIRETNVKYSDLKNIMKEKLKVEIIDWDD